MAQASGNPDGHLGVDSRLRDILHHPAFAEFGRLLLPWDGRTYDEDLRLSDIGSLLPYHSHVSPEVVVSALNHMIDDARNGKTIFYDIYSDAQKRDEPARAHTGLFFFRGRPGPPSLLLRRVAASLMWALSMRAFRTPWRSARKATMLSF